MIDLVKLRKAAVKIYDKKFNSTMALIRQMTTLLVILKTTHRNMRLMR